MRLILETITVRCQPLDAHNETVHAAGNQAVALESPDGMPEPLPLALLWRRQWYLVLIVQATWHWRGAWWTTPDLKGQERIYYRVLCASSHANNSTQGTSGANSTFNNELCMEIYSEKGDWMLSRLLD